MISTIEIKARHSLQFLYPMVYSTRIVQKMVWSYVSQHIFTLLKHRCAFHELPQFYGEECEHSDIIESWEFCMRQNQNSIRIVSLRIHDNMAAALCNNHFNTITTPQVFHKWFFMQTLTYDSRVAEVRLFKLVGGGGWIIQMIQT